MKKIGLIIACLAIVGCGYTSVNNELICQPKKLHNETPMICGDYVDVDVSLGAMVNGVGSMSTQDMWLVVPSADDRKSLQAAIDQGKLVKLTYNERRLQICQNADEVVTSVTVVEK